MSLVYLDNSSSVYVMVNYQHQKSYSKKNQQTVPEIILIGLGRAIWWLITLPFHRGTRKTRGISVSDKQYIIKKRIEIEEMSSSDNIYELKHAVIEADKLVDYILQIKGYAGDTFADRLRSAEKNMNASTYQRLWDGHKIRNQIAHQDDKFSRDELVRAIKQLLSYATN